jgi:hypothetical protein
VRITTTADEYYYIKVFGFGGAINPNYTLAIEADSTPVGADRFESNDSFGTAKNLGTLGDRSEADLTLHFPLDKDFFKLTAAATGTLNVDIAFVRALGDIDLLVIDAAQQIMGSATTGAANGEHLAVQVVAGGTYYIEVFSGNGDTNPDYDLIIDGPSVVTNPSTISFQDGVAPNAAYAGTRDTYIKADSASANFAKADLLVNGAPDVAALIRWDLSSVSPGSSVQSVSVTFNVGSKSANSYELYELKRNWTEDQATWNVAATGVNWQTAGAQGASDRGTTVLGAITASATGLLTINLNAAGVQVVQNWINNPQTNFGFAIMDYAAANDDLQLRSSEASTKTNRPRLTIDLDSPAAAGALVLSQSQSRQMLLQPSIDTISAFKESQQQRIALSTTADTRHQPVSNVAVDSLQLESIRARALASVAQSYRKTLQRSLEASLTDELLLAIATR